MLPAGRFLKVELRDRHAKAVIAHERKRGIEIFDRRKSAADDINPAE